MPKPKRTSRTARPAPKPSRPTLPSWASRMIQVARFARQSAALLERTAALLEANAERRSERRAHGRRKGTEPGDIEMEMEKSAFHMRRTVDEMERWAAQVESNELPRHQMEAGAQQRR